MRTEILRLEHISKCLNSYTVLNGISFNLYRGEAICVITEELDVKNCMIDYLCGITTCDLGTMYLNDKKIILDSLTNAHSKGIFYVNESQMIETMNVENNLFCTFNDYYSLGLINHRKMHIAAKDILEKYHLSYISPLDRLSSLSHADIYLLSILHAVVSGVKILILDNTYNFYAEQKIQQLQTLLLQLKKEGISILLITNKWDPQLHIFDRISLIKNGVTTQTIESTENAVTKFLPSVTLSPLLNTASSSPGPKGTLLFEAQNIVEADRPQMYPINFQVYENEILGLCDIDWKMGKLLKKILTGQVDYRGDFLVRQSPETLNDESTLIKHHIAMVSNNDYKQKIFTNLDIYDNITLLFNKPMFNKAGLLNRRIRNHIARHITELIHSEYLLSKYRSKKQLSTMNMQDQARVEIAKWLCINPKLFIFFKPYDSFQDLTLYEFKSILKDIKAQGITIVIVSMNKSYLMELCGRIVSLPKEE